MTPQEKAMRQLYENIYKLIAELQAEPWFRFLCFISKIF